MDKFLDHPHGSHRRMTRRLLVVLLLLASALVLPGAGATAEAVAPTVVVTIGTSIPAGTGAGSVSQSWPERLEDLTGLNVVDRSLGGGAYTADNSAGDNIRKHVDAAIVEFADVENKVMILDGPVNDLVRLSIDQIGQLNWAVHYADEAARNAGWHVVGQAILPFNDCSGCAFQAGWWPNLEQRRDAYNSWGAAHFAGRWADPFVWLKETGTDRGDRRWYPDGLHPREIGCAVIAEAFPKNTLEVP